MPEFRRLLEQETPALSRYARRLCRNSLWAEDLLQETLLLALRLENGFTVGTNMRAWLFTLMKNTYRNETRKRRRRGLITVEEQQGEYTIECPNRQETSLALQQTLQAVETLPPAYRETLLLVAVHGLSYAETAQKTGKPVGTVRSRLAPGPQKVKRNIGRVNQYPMTNVRKLPPSELDLQAYMDDELQPAARLRVIEWLLENPKNAQELFEAQLREDLLRVAVKLSLMEDSQVETYSVQDDSSQSFSFQRFDRFATGFVAALLIWGFATLLMT